MNVKQIAFLTLCPVLTAFAAAAQAGALIVDGGAPDQSNAFLADASHDHTIAATRFSLADAVDVIQFQLEWWGIYFPTGAAAVADDFTLAIYLDASGLPGTALATIHLGQVQREATGQTVIQFPEYVYTAVFAMSALDAGDYFLGLGNDPAGTDLWGWETTSEGLQAGGASYHPASGAWQEDTDENLAFRLSVPAPGSLALLAIGGAGLVRNRRRAQSARRA